ncbi:transcriptional regulator [Mesorhizobium sp. KR1-2]|uniref:transcriptional regulator n=1 Tax=Mesorhizobium sp. KR1-2 TaxID=3156609 RepID=UPI0032B53BAC
MTAGTTTALERARSGWGDDLPDWIEALAIACDSTSQAKAAKAMGYTPAVVSTLLRRTYAADLSRVEKAARGAFMAATVECPVLGIISAGQCVHEQRAPFDSTSHQRVVLFRMCRSGRCPHSSHGE